MSNHQKKKIIENALRDYHSAKLHGDSECIERAINGMENAFICVSLFPVPGVEQLRQTILSARGYASC